jgi:hypothetical protein
LETGVVGLGDGVTDLGVVEVVLFSSPLIFASSLNTEFKFFLN